MSNPMSVIERGDIVALKDGREVEILSIKTDGDELRKFDYIDRKEHSPMRKTEGPAAILRLLRKGNIRKIDPLAVLPHDNPTPPPLNVRIVEDISNSTPVIVNKSHTKGKGK